MSFSSYSGIWDQFTIRDGLPDTRIESLYEDSDGYLWIGTHTRGVVLYNGETFRCLGEEEGLHAEGVFSIVQMDDGAVCLGTNSGLYVGDTRGFRLVEATVGRSFLWGSCLDAEGNLWIGLEGAPNDAPLIGMWNGAEFIVLCVTDVSRDLGGSVTSLAFDQEGSLWCGGEHLYKIESIGNGGHSVFFEGFTKIRALCDTAHSGLALIGREGCFITESGEFSRMSIGADADGLCSQGDQVWVGHRSGELCIVSNSSTRTAGNAGVPLWHPMLIDRVGRMWVGTYGFGLVCYDETRITVADSATGLCNRVHALAIEDDEVWCGTSVGLLDSRGEVGIGRADLGGGSGRSPLDSEITSLALHPCGGLWIGKRNGVVYVKKQDEIVQCETCKAVWHHSVDSMVVDVEGRVWIASRFGSGIGVYQSTTCVEVLKGDGVPEHVACMALGPEGTIVLASSDPGDRYAVYGVRDGGVRPILYLDREGASAMIFDHEGRLWIGTNHGLRVYDESYVTTYRIPDGLSSELITALYEDSVRRLWVGTEGGGVCVLDGSVVQSLSLEQRPLYNSVNAIGEGADGAIWFATNGGLVRRQLRESSVRVGVLEVVANSVLKNPERVHLSDSVGRAVFRISGASACCRTSGLVFRYRMRGLDAEWQQTQNREVSYGRMASGKYTFQVQAIDVDLNYSDVATVDVVVAADPRIAALNRALRAESAQGEFVCESVSMREVRRQIAEVAWTDLSVLILGETGTGKGLAAREIHELSERRDGPFIHVNCGSIQGDLVESELFGHERGAFTGAVSQRLGRFELAEGGTIFLDEVGDLPSSAQVRLLKVLQERTFERLGGSQTLRVDVRVVAATNRDLEELVRREQFRADLFFRLNVFPIRVPPLRERRGDTLVLARHFVESFAAHLSRSMPALSQDAEDLLVRYSWPGNVRELEHVMQRAVILCSGTTITARELGVEVRDEVKAASEVRLSAESSAVGEIMPLEEYERRYFIRVLALTSGVIHGKRGAAEILGMKPTTLRSRLEKLGIKKRRTRGPRGNYDMS